MKHDYKYIQVDQPAEAIRRIAINVPEKRNALSPPIVAELALAFTEAMADATVQALVLTGTGGAFCAGGDLKSMDDMTEASARQRMQRNHAFAAQVRGSCKPVVVALEGVAMGGGAGLALLGDAVVAGPGSRIGFPFLRVGLVPDYGLMHSLGRRAGWPAARQMILRCKTLQGREALEAGLFDEWVDEDDYIQSRAIELAMEFSRLPRGAFLEVKRAFAEFPRNYEDDMAHELEAQVAAFIGPELAEGVAAFREKREPDFMRLGSA